MASKILVKFKEAVLKDIPIDKEVLTIGRKPTNDIHVDNLAVSSAHARIFKRGDQYYVEDLNSLNGTFVNGKKVQVHALINSDVIIIGKHTLIFQTDAPALTKPEDPKVRGMMDETILIDAKVAEEILAKAGTKVSTGETKEVVGGLAVIEGSSEHKEYELLDRITTIGKDKNASIKLKGLFAPKIAALINRKKDGYTISPSAPGSKGPKINGHEIEGKYDLQEGDILEVSGLKMQFYLKE